MIVNRKKLTFILGILQSIIALFAILSFFFQLINPEMALRALDEGMKDSSFVESSTMAGFILTIMSGIFSIISAFVSFSNQKSSGYLGLLLGMFLPAWIAIRFNLVGYINFWQIVFLFVFILEIAISLALIRRHYLKERKKLASKIE